MESLTKTQDEIIAKADFRAGYPRVVHVGMGIIALANNKEEFDKLQRRSLMDAVVIAAGLAIIGLGAIGFMVYRAIVT